MSIMSSVSVAVSMTHDDEKMKRSRVVTVGSPTLGGGEGAGRRRTITSYFVVVTSVCSLLSNGMSRMRMSNESPPDPMRMACHSGVGVAWNTLVPDDDVAMILKTIYSSTSKEDLAG